jgi:hypothetical protein
MKIRITKAADDKWYKKLVGRVMVARTHENMPNHYILRNYRTILRTVRREDAEEV